ncbi:cob(I)yrinic acid a,c-diamide adenosyltransferase [Aurantibacillus circumpalustris]|uniref:cob(I)yrinic acid a,c-diamide adenosyltransferase n=1 Tax=Aurantibacillus circumpalustris TaxID=3036359 RepID=UPI00295BCDDC|nr:cob(I)yrinic acid a,c-diamide adenosyltransferase [Aurantibacillus circumpalustris]
MAFKIYTKTGDKGLTSLIGGTRLPKHHIRIEAYGTVDELNSHIGLLRDITTDKTTSDLLIHIQDRLFTIGSHLAADPVKSKMQLPPIFEEDVVMLEKAIDVIDKIVPEMKSFVLPGGHVHVSYCHIARCVCRRAERSVLRLAENELVDSIHIKYLNRLSDYLFMLSRWFTLELKASEIPWKPKM